MVENGKILIGINGAKAYLEPSMANRHGLITGASGTGKTTTVKVMAESLSMMGVPVFLSDVKGDLGGVCLSGEDTKMVRDRCALLGFREYTLTSFPTCFWDVYGENGVAVRTTISDMGPMLLSKIMNLTEVQQSVLNVVFRIADDEGLLLIDVKDLDSMLQYAIKNRAEYSELYGGMSAQSLNAIRRQLLTLEEQGGDVFFGEPALDIFDWMRVDASGRGYINILDCVRLYRNPALYAAFLLFLLSELFERLPEAGDLDKPKIAFFFDEAHLLFSDANKILTQKIEQMAKLIRSKGVGVYFITQSPGDLPDCVLSQLSNRVQHALRAYTPADQRAVRAAADAFRVNPAFDAREVIGQLGVGEALVSCLDAKGQPTPVERVWILPPQSRAGVPSPEIIRHMIDISGMDDKYSTAIDRRSAYEHLTEQARLEQREAVRRDMEKRARVEAEAREKERLRLEREMEREQKRRQAQLEKAARPLKRVTDSALSGIGRQLGRELVRGLFSTSKRW
ncbi:MAG: DUF853 family protein [Clostridia bacterium]|nr:DUF853 family protein [Clostridia bacterium]